jgi:hypothetical protein
MDHFLKRKLTPASDNDEGTSGDVMENIDGGTRTSIKDANATNTNNIVQRPLRISRHEVNFDELPYDPADRRKISDYIGEKLQNKIRRKYLIRGPFRPPPSFKYPQKIIAGVTLFLSLLLTLIFTLTMCELTLDLPKWPLFSELGISAL